MQFISGIPCRHGSEIERCILSRAKLLSQRQSYVGAASIRNACVGDEVSMDHEIYVD